MKFFIPLNQILFSNLHTPNMQITHIAHISLMFYLVLIAKLLFMCFEWESYTDFHTSGKWDFILWAVTWQRVLHWIKIRKSDSIANPVLLLSFKRVHAVAEMMNLGIHHTVSHSISPFNYTKEDLIKKKSCLFVSCLPWPPLKLMQSTAVVLFSF